MFHRDTLAPLLREHGMPSHSQPNNNKREKSRCWSVRAPMQLRGKLRQGRGGSQKEKKEREKKDNCSPMMGEKIAMPGRTASASSNTHTHAHTQTTTKTARMSLLRLLLQASLTVGQLAVGLLSTVRTRGRAAWSGLDVAVVEELAEEDEV